MMAIQTELGCGSWANESVAMQNDFWVGDA